MGDRWESFKTSLHHHTVGHVNDTVVQPLADWQEQREQLQQLREDLSNQISTYRRARGMDEAERVQKLRDLKNQRWNARFQSAALHPIAVPLRLATTPFRFLFHALRGADGAEAHTTDASIFWFWILAVVYHAVIVATPMTLLDKFIFNVVLILISVLFIFHPTERNGDTFRALLLCFFIEVGIPFIITQLPVIAALNFVRLYITNGLIMLTWFYYAVYRGKDSNVTVIKISKLAIIIFWTFVLLSYAFASNAGVTDIEIDAVSGESFKAFSMLTTKFTDGMKQTKDTFFGVFKRGQESWELRKKQLASTYYVGQVEENENEPIGVYLEELTPAKKEFYDDEPVTVFGLMKAKTLDDAITIVPGCFAGKGTEIVYGTVYPKAIEVVDMQQEELDCSIARNKLKVGTHKVSYTADFNFETVGYLKRYFTDRERMNNALRDGVDLLDFYQIEDKDPVARYTNGPVRMGIGPEAALIGVDSTSEIKPRIGVTLDAKTSWNGVIKQVNQVVLLIPNSMKIDLSTCSDMNFKEYTKDMCIESNKKYQTQAYRECKEGGATTDSEMQACLSSECDAELTEHNGYYIDTTRNAKNYQNIKDFISFTCRLDIIDQAALLGNTPISTKYFFVKARYTYQVTKDTSVRIIASEDEHTTSSSSIDTTDPKVLATEIYRKYYATPPYSIKTWSSLYDSPLTEPEVVIAFIAALSKGDPNLVKRDSVLGQTYGLMQIPEAEAKKIAQELSMTNYDLLDPDTNIKFGIKYLYNLQYEAAIPHTLIPNPDSSLVLAAYYTGICDQTTKIGAFCDSQKCIGKQKYECELDTEYAPGRLLPAVVGSYLTSVQSQHLLEAGTLKDELNEDTFLDEVTLNLTDPAKTAVHEYLLDANTKVVVNAKAEKTFEVYYVDTSVMTQTGSTQTAVSKQIEGKYIPTSTEFHDRWLYLDSAPIMRYKFLFNDQGKVQSLVVQGLKNSVINSGYVIESSDPFEIWKNYIWIVYDDDILTLYYKDYIGNYKKFCSVKWVRESTLERCKEHPGFYIRNRETVEQMIFADYANIQLEYNSKAEFSTMHGITSSTGAGAAQGTGTSTTTSGAGTGTQAASGAGCMQITEDIYAGKSSNERYALADSIYGSTEDEVNMQIKTFDLKGETIEVHETIVPALTCVMNELNACPEAQAYQVYSTSSFSWRNVPGTSSRSMHSYGIAIDINPSDNPFCTDTSDPNAPTPYDPKNLCGGKNVLKTDLPQCMIDAFKHYGFFWGGEWNSMKDAMHFEFHGDPSKLSQTQTIT